MSNRGQSCDDTLETRVVEGEILFLLMLLDVIFRKADQMRGVDQSHLFGFFFSLLDRPPVTQHPPDHPEGSDPNRRTAMNERRSVFGIIGDLEELIRLFVFRLGVNDWDVDISQSQLLRLRFFFRGAVFAGLSKIDNRLHAISLELGQMFDARLAAGAELFTN